MAKDYGLVSLTAIIILIPLTILMLMAVRKWKEKRSQIAFNLLFTIVGLMLSIVFFLWGALIREFAPLDWSFEAKVWIYICAQSSQVAAHYFIFNLTNELWPVKHRIVKRIILCYAFGIFIYFAISAIQGWGFLPIAPENKDIMDMAPTSYVVMGVFFLYIEIRGAYYAMQTVSRVGLKMKENREEKSLAQRQLTAMRFIAIFLVGLLGLNILLLLDLNLSTPFLYYIGMGLLPFLVLCAYLGFFPREVKASQKV